MKTTTRSVLTEFLAATAPDRAQRTRQRDAAIAADLLAFLDHIDADQLARYLGHQLAELFSLERAFDGVDGSFFRMFSAGDLVCCLPGYLEGLRGDDVRDSARIAFVGRLLRWIARRGLLGSEVMCAFYDAEAAVTRARRRRRGDDG